MHVHYWIVKESMFEQTICFRTVNVYRHQNEFLLFHIIAENQIQDKVVVYVNDTRYWIAEAMCEYQKQKKNREGYRMYTEKTSV